MVNDAQSAERIGIGIGIGIVGTGRIAGVLAKSIHAAEQAELVAVSSRTQAKANQFAAEHAIPQSVAGVEALLQLDTVQGVYIATPTAAKYELAQQALSADRHVIIEKPLPAVEQYRQLATLAEERGLVLIDATHFVHHPRTHQIQQRLSELVGRPRSLHASFFAPLEDRENIRFDPKQEPSGVLGDLGWYCLRAVVEYLQPQGELAACQATAERDAQTKAIVRIGGHLSFADGRYATFDCGFNAGTLIMDLSLIGTQGMVAMDDYVLDWENSWASQNTQTPAGFVHRTGSMNRAEFEFVATPSEKPADVLMIDAFAHLIHSGDHAAHTKWMKKSIATQRMLDAVLRSVS